MQLFEWDSAKADANSEKHGVDFTEAATVFDDDLAYVGLDEAHSVGEFRFFILGISDQGRLLVVAYTFRDEVVRIINARPATNNERKQYESGEIKER